MTVLDRPEGDGELKPYSLPAMSKAWAALLSAVSLVFQREANFETVSGPARITFLPLLNPVEDPSSEWVKLGLASGLERWGLAIPNWDIISLFPALGPINPETVPNLIKMIALEGLTRPILSQLAQLTGQSVDYAPETPPPPKGGVFLWFSNCVGQEPIEDPPEAAKKGPDKLKTPE
ncbi:MAG: hypothetical protein LBV23_10175, partial [Deltaproteobacteria bacterium]|nr:hypothetical protein [Deltaproteobacteria bacterium]